ncbi:MAG TPA: lysine--tRNA ligase [Candidatus Thermoplasmatota archaeon]|nr:lysine--tRNA ligase [Candidatus Thermoplasmatota archaeon]
MARDPLPTPEDYSALLGTVDPEQVKKVVGLGKKAWPYSFKAERDLAGLRAKLEARFQPGTKGNAPGEKRYRVAGRLRAKRGSGGIAFLDLEGQDAKMQAILDKAEMGDEAFTAALHLLNEGDFVGVAGYGMRSKRGEPSIGAERVVLLAKALVPFVDLGGSDNPNRYHKPYLAYMQGPAARDVIVKRALITKTVRTVLEKDGFVEAAIPVLERLYGGANAKPFTTHSNAKDSEMFLRISLELALKKLLVGGLERVYHIGPVFRNEDIDTTHNPEFTLMECYAAYWDYTGMMRLTEKLFQKAVAAVNGGSLQIKRPDGTVLDFAKFQVVTMYDAIRQHGGPDPETVSDEEVRKILAEADVHIRGGYSRGLGIAKLFEVYAERNLVQPTFVIDHPRETTPLCKPHRKDPALVERFELFIGGIEHANAYSELNDPYLQAKLFKEQEERRKGGDDEAPPTDHEFVEALKHGMPPAGGLGVGIDRMVMTLLGIDSIKAVLPFPQVK